MNGYKKINNESIDKKSINAPSDDYIKFIRFYEFKIENSNEGLLEIITNNVYLDNITFRGMRSYLLSTFDEIYIINLHGNLRKKYTTDDGGIDENVFDIQIEVSIGIFIKYKDEAKKNKLANIFYKSIKGKREEKYKFLSKNTIFTANFKKLGCKNLIIFLLKKIDQVRIFTIKEFL